jgi:hypothetical protein
MGQGIGDGKMETLETIELVYSLACGIVLLLMVFTAFRKK